MSEIREKRGLVTAVLLSAVHIQSHKGNGCVIGSECTNSSGCTDFTKKLLLYYLIYFLLSLIQIVTVTRAFIRITYCIVC
jgi:hypothetical protein